MGLPNLSQPKALTVDAMRELTDNDDVAEGVSLADGGAVPPLGSELVLTLEGGELDAVPYRHHGVGGSAAHVPLTRRQTRHPAADDVRPQRHDAGHHPATRHHPVK